MKIISIGVLDNNQKTFSFEGARVPQKWAIKQVSDETLKKVSNAITATGIAGVMLGISNKDYIEAISVPIDRSNLSPESMSALEEGYNYYPVLMDTLLSETTSYDSIRDIDEKSIKKFIEAYELDSDLTEKLIRQKDENNNFKFGTNDILYIVKANSINPDLLEIAKLNPTFVNRLLNIANENGQPSYGVNDIKYFYEARQINDSLTEKLLNQHYINGDPRFNGEDALFVVKNSKNSFLNYLLELQNIGSARTKSVHRFDGTQIVEIMDSCKTKEDERFIKELINLSSETHKRHIFSDKEILKIIKSDSVEIAKYFSRSLDKNKLNKVLKMKSEILPYEQLLELSKIKNEKNQPVFSDSELEALAPTKATIIALRARNRNLSLNTMSQIENFALDYPELTDMIFNKTYSTKLVKSYLIKNNTRPYFFKFDNHIALKLFETAKTSPEIVHKILKYVDSTSFLEGYPVETQVSRLLFESIMNALQISEKKREKCFEKMVPVRKNDLFKLYQKLNELKNEV